MRDPHSPDENAGSLLNCEASVHSVSIDSLLSTKCLWESVHCNLLPQWTEIKVNIINCLAHKVWAERFVLAATSNWVCVYSSRVLHIPWSVTTWQNWKGASWDGPRIKKEASWSSIIPSQWSGAEQRAGGWMLCAARRLQADFEANSLLFSPLLHTIIRLEDTLLVKQMEVIMWLITVQSVSRTALTPLVSLLFS